MSTPTHPDVEADGFAWQKDADADHEASRSVWAQVRQKAGADF